MQCKIIIKTVGEGWQDELKCNAEFLTVNGARQILYKIQNDDSVLLIEEDKVVQKRRGEVNVDLLFIEGKTTPCKIITQGLNGGYNVFTESVEKTPLKNGYKLQLNYVNDYSNEKIKLTLFAIFNTQEKL
ncbi:MAG: DUF1934 family protein [Clostridia bacterium]|nr:DUF1934 family protein [Clostridia bacterium]